MPDSLGRKATAWPVVGIYVRPIKRGKHHVLAAAFLDGRWQGLTACGRYVDRSTWEAQDAYGWAPEDGCRRCTGGSDA